MLVNGRQKTCNCSKLYCSVCQVNSLMSASILLNYNY